MTRDELHDRFIREGVFPGTPKGRGLINDLVIDAKVCEQTTCEGYGHKGLELVTYMDEAGDCVFHGKAAGYSTQTLPLIP